MKSRDASRICTNHEAPHGPATAVRPCRSFTLVGLSLGSDRQGGVSPLNDRDGPADNRSAVTPPRRSCRCPRVSMSWRRNWVSRARSCLTGSSDGVWTSSSAALASLDPAAVDQIRQLMHGSAASTPTPAAETAPAQPSPRATTPETPAIERDSPTAGSVNPECLGRYFAGPQ